MLLLVHGEVTDPAVDFFDREAVFIDRHLAPLLDKVVALQMCALCHTWTSSIALLLLHLSCAAPLRHLSHLAQVPDLKVVMEHITTADAVEFVTSGPTGRLAATITPQHILLNRNSLFQVTPKYSLVPTTVCPSLY